jgi:hypothetical protein
MVLVALALMAVGLLVATLGYKLFRILLPIVGFISGTMIGFTGFQGIYGKGAVSTTVAVFVALTVGLIMAVLSFAYFEIAVIVLTAILSASLFAFLGIALGLNDDGFVVFLLALSGFVLGLMLASNGVMGASFVTILTSMLGVAFILAGVFLVVGTVSLDDLHNDGIVSTVLGVVDQSFLWLIVWLGGSLFANQIQLRTMMLELAGDSYEYVPAKTRK